jgi:hypothetical protein
MDNLNIVLELEKQKFVVISDEGERLGKMSFFFSEDDLITVDHTKVSKKLQGKGMGGKLVEAGVEFARKNGYKINATCPYAKKELGKNKEKYADVLGPVLREESEPEEGEDY